jgi:hypothetical protein
MVETTLYKDGDPTYGAYYVVSGLYPALTLRDGQGNEVRITRVPGHATPSRETRHEAEGRRRHGNTSPA